MDLGGVRVDSFQCRNHPEREGVGICVACRRVFCIECSTKIDGVNHCRECLGRRQKTAAALSAPRAGLLLRAFELVLALGLVLGSVAFVFGALVLVGEANAKGAGKRVANRDRMEAIARGLRSYKRDTSAFPTDAEGLRALVAKPEGVTGWHGPYVDPAFAPKDEVLDAFDQPVQYRSPRAGETACLVGSPGGDRVLQTDLDTVERSKAAPGTGEAMSAGDDLVLFVD